MLRSVVGDALLAAGVAAVLLSCLGVLVVRRLEDQLHYLAPASSLGAVLVGLAVAVQAGPGRTAAQALIVAAILAGTGPVTTTVLARTARQPDPAQQPDQGQQPDPGEGR